MIEFGPDDLDHLDADVEVVFGTLKYEPRSRAFNVARVALQRLGAVYDWRIRAWRVPVGNESVEVLKRLYSRSSLALWVPEPGETVTAASFERYTG